MAELLTTDALSLLLVSFFVGIAVGLTGMGGGALMTPALIFLGIPPTSAVANDLVSASVSKSVGAGVHWRSGSPNLQVAKWLMLGSVPTAFAGAFIIQAIGTTHEQQQFLIYAIGAVLLLAASTYVLRMYLNLRTQTGSGGRASGPVVVKPVRTVAVGALGGLLVGLTSVGSGSLIMVLMLLLYPAMAAVKLVGTDLVQAVPLVLAAAVGHVIVTGVDWEILIPLLIGSSPGTFVGARLSNWVSQQLVRRGIVIVLMLTGVKMLGASAGAVAVTGAALLIFGPAAWGVVRATRGLPAFEHLPPNGNKTEEGQAPGTQTGGTKR